MSSRLIPPKPGAMAAHDAHDLVRVLRIEANGPGIDPGQLPEKHGLAFHHGKRGLRPQIPQPQHGRPIRHHGHAVTFAGQPVGKGRVCGDRLAHAANARCIGHGKRIGAFDLKVAGDVDFPALVRHENPVGQGNGTAVFRILEALQIFVEGLFGGFISDSHRWSGSPPIDIVHPMPTRFRRQV